MVSHMREKNKSLVLRYVFKWGLLVVSLAYLLILVMGHITAGYTEVKTMMLDEDKEQLRRNEVNFERTLNKVIPNFLSYWNFGFSIVMVGVAFALFKIQQVEEEEGKKVDLACLDIHKDIRFNSINPFGASHHQGQLLSVSNHQYANALLTFKPYQVQKCVLIFKDFKFKAEILVTIQIGLLVLIANAQYCVYGLPYLIMSVVQLLNIALTHGRSDQNIRVFSSVFTVILLIYVPVDLVAHYVVHFLQECDRIDDEYDSKYFDQPSTYQLQGYHGIMATTPSYVTFGFKMALLILECIKYKYSYDMGSTYDKLKSTFLNAESSALTQSKGLLSKNTHQFQEQADRKNEARALAEPAANEGEEQKFSEEEGLLMRRNQQNSADFQRRQRYNKLLKLQYIRIFKKSSSFVHRILQPISLFMLSLAQLIFILNHPSILFIVLLGLSVTGFFVELKDQQATQSFFTRSKIVLCIELLYVFTQYFLNIFRFENMAEIEKKEELGILLGLGTEQ